MADATCTIEFRGRVSEGADPAEVKRRVAALLKIDGARADQLFSGTPMVRRGLKPLAAARYEEAFRRAGAVLEVRPDRVEPAPAPAAAVGRAAPPARPTNPKSGPPIPAPLDGAEPAFACPKCGFVQPRGLDCTACGVVFAKLGQAPGGTPRQMLDANRVVPEMVCPYCEAIQPAADACRDCGKVTAAHNPGNPGVAERLEAARPSASDSMEEFKRRLHQPSHLGIALGVAITLFGAVPFAWCLVSGYILGYAVPVMVIGGAIIVKSIQPD